MTDQSINPFDGQFGKTFPGMTDPELKVSVAAAASCFATSRHTSCAELPFGRIKGSGYGREHGHMGIQAFVNKKLVRTASMNAPV